MWKASASVIILLLCWYTYTLQQQISSLSQHVASQQEELANLRHTIVTGDTHAALALKLSVVNQNTILDMQRRRKVTVTAYSPRPKETDTTPYHTATNRKVRHGIVAVSRDLFDKGWVFGRKVYIESLGVFTIDDLMARHKRNQIDIFMFDTDKALTFGKKTLKAHLLALDLPQSHTAPIQGNNTSM